MNYIRNYISSKVTEFSFYMAFCVCLCVLCSRAHIHSTNSWYHKWQQQKHVLVIKPKRKVNECLVQWNVCEYFMDLWAKEERRQMMLITIPRFSDESGTPKPHKPLENFITCEVKREWSLIHETISMQQWHLSANQSHEHSIVRCLPLNGLFTLKCSISR